MARGRRHGRPDLGRIGARAARRRVCDWFRARGTEVPPVAPVLEDVFFRLPVEVRRDRARGLECAEGFVPFRGYRPGTARRRARPRHAAAPVPARRPRLVVGLPRAPRGARRTAARSSGYDQLGCGDSDRPDDDSLWTLELFVSEVQAVRDALGLDRVHLLGTSWGGMLAQEYALTAARGAREPRPLLHARECRALDRARPAGCRAELGPDTTEEQFNAAPLLPPRPTAAGAGGRGRPSATRRSTRRCGGRTSGPAPAVSRAGRRASGSGGSGFRRWSLRGALRHVHRGGRRASSSRESTAPRSVVFEHSSHTPVIEEPERYRAVVGDFLAGSRPSL